MSKAKRRIQTQFGSVDIPLINRAIRERFDIPEDTRKDMVDSMSVLMTDDEASDKDRIAAAGVLARLDAINISHQKIMMPHVRINTSVEMLTDEEIESQIAELEQQLDIPKSFTPTAQDLGEPLDAGVIPEVEARNRGKFKAKNSGK